MLISPTEPPALRALGLTSSVPEEYGADIAIPSSTFGLVGVQRKEFGDLVSSLHDGRLAEQLGKMGDLGAGMFIIEGEPRWSHTGESMRFPGMTQAQYRAASWSIQSRGYWLTSTRDLADTIECLTRLEQWLSKKHHHGLRQRPGPVVRWGHPKNRDYAVHLLSSLPGIGGELAGRIYDAVGLPLRWTVGEAELCQIEGVGKKKAQRILGLFEPASSDVSAAT